MASGDASASPSNGLAGPRAPMPRPSMKKRSTDMLAMNNIHCPGNARQKGAPAYALADLCLSLITTCYYPGNSANPSIFTGNCAITGQNSLVVTENCAIVRADCVIVRQNSAIVSADSFIVRGNCVIV